MNKMAHTRKSTTLRRVELKAPLLLGVLVASSFVILGSSSIPEVHAAQPIPSSEYFGNTYNSTQASIGAVALTNTTQLIDARFTARYNGDAIPRVSVYADYFNTNAKYDVVIGVQTDDSGNPSGQFLGAFVWNVTSGLCNGCGGWVYPGFAPKSYNLSHTITMVAGTVYHLVVKYYNGTFVNTGGCYGTDCLAFQYIGGTNFQQESLDVHYDPSQALLACGNITSCDMVPGANAVYALDINGSAWSQGQTESMVLDRPIGAANGGAGLDSFQGERFWMAWNSVTVNRLQVLLSKIGTPTGSLNVLVWNFTAPSAADILSASNPRLMLNQSLIPNLDDLSPVGDKSYNFSLSRSLTLEYGHMYQMSFAIYGNTTTINGASELGIEVTNSNYNSNPLNWDGSNGSPNSPCWQYALGCAGFRYTGSTGNAAAEEWGYEDIVFIMKIEYTAVAQSISVQMSGSAPAALVSVEGCHASPSAFSSDGAPHVESIDPSCAFSLFFNNNGSTRAGFQVDGSFSATSPSQTSCAVDACPELDLIAFDQVENTFRATPTTPTNWDAELTIPVTGIQLGLDDTGCAISTSAGGGRAVCQAWFDYGTSATISNAVAASNSERWFAPGQNTFVQRTGGNNYTAGYIDQFNVTFAVTPVNSGTVYPSDSSLWESYGSITINETAERGFGFVSWATNTPRISLAAKNNSSTIAVVHGSGTITATFAALITQPITLSIAERGGQAATFLLSGCSVSPTSLFGNGASLTVTATPSCSIHVTSPADSQALRYRFRSGGQPSSTISVPTCSQGACPAASSIYYEQLSETFAYTIVGGGSPSFPSLNFTSLGENTSQTEAATPTPMWLDFGTHWSLNDLLPGSSQSERWASSSATNGTTPVSGNETTAYQHQYSIAIAASPDSCGTTTPSGLTWEPAEAVFSIEVSGSKDCAFDTWNSTSGILIARPTTLNSTVTAQGPGTITASFTKALLPSSTRNTQIVYAGILVGVAVLTGCIVLIARRRSASNPEGDFSMAPTAASRDSRKHEPETRSVKTSRT